MDIYIITGSKEDTSYIPLNKTQKNCFREFLTKVYIMFYNEEVILSCRKAVQEARMVKVALP
jgi:hypothetical protein